MYVIYIYIAFFLLIFGGKIECYDSNTLNVSPSEEIFTEWLNGLNFTQDVIKERFITLLNMIDLNKDGVLTNTELVPWLRFILDRTGYREASIEFKYLDIDNDDIITKDEFIDHYIGNAKDENNIELELLKVFYNDLFRIMDINNDDKLNKNEYYKLVHEYTINGEFYDQIRKIVKEFDKNNNNILEKDELDYILKQRIDIEKSYNKSDIDEFINSVVTLEPFSLLGVNLTDVDSINISELIKNIKNNELNELVLENFLQLNDLYINSFNETSSNSNSNKDNITDIAINITHVLDKFVLFVQSSLTDYGDVFRFPQDFFLNHSNPNYELSQKDCLEKFGENQSDELDIDKSDLENFNQLDQGEIDEIEHQDIDLNFENDGSSPEDINIDQKNIEINDEMIEKLLAALKGDTDMHAGFETEDSDFKAILDMFKNMMKDEGFKKDFENLDFNLKDDDPLINQNYQMGEDNNLSAHDDLSQTPQDEL